MYADSTIDMIYEDLEPNDAAIGRDDQNTQIDIGNIFSLVLEMEVGKQPEKNSYKYCRICESTNIEKRISIKSEDRKCSPTVKIKNLEKASLKVHGSIKLEVSLYTDTLTLHPYLLKSSSKNRLILSKDELLKLNNDRNMYRYYYNVDLNKQECVIDGLHIIQIPKYMTKEAIERHLYKKQQLLGKDFKDPVSFLADIQMKEFGDLNTARLKFQLVLFDEKNKQFIKYLTSPLYSEPIKDTKSEIIKKKIAQNHLFSSPLQIIRCSKVIGHIGGNESLMLFTNELKDTRNLEIEFYQCENNKRVWEERIKVKQKDIINKCSIVFKTPKYNEQLLIDKTAEVQNSTNNHHVSNNKQLIKSHPVKVFFRLSRTNCNQTSNEWSFYFTKAKSTLSNELNLNHLNEINNTLSVENGANVKTECNLNNQVSQSNGSSSNNSEETKKKIHELSDRTAGALLEVARSRSIHKVLKTQRYLLNTQNTDGNTPLHLCILNGNFDLLEIIVDCALTIPHYNIINVKNNYQLTPLLLAAHIGESEVCDFLLEANSSLTEVDLNGNNCFHIACKQRNLKLVKVLSNFIKKNVDKSSVINICNYEGETPLQIAVKHNAYDIVEELIYTPPCRLEERNKRNGMNALHYSATYNYLQVSRLMLEFINKADELRTNNKLLPEFIDAQANNGCTPLHMAIANKNYLIVRLLLKFNANAFLESLESAHPKSTSDEGKQDRVNETFVHDEVKLSEDTKNTLISQESQRCYYANNVLCVGHNNDAYDYAGDDQIMLEVLRNEQYVPKRILNKIFKFEFDRKKERLPVQKQTLCDQLVGKKDNNQEIDFIEHFENKIREFNPGFQFNRVIETTPIKRSAAESYAASPGSIDSADDEGTETPDIKRTRKDLRELMVT